MPELLTMDDNVYHSASYRNGGKYLSYHDLKTFARSPYILHRQRAGYIPQETTKALEMGRLVHAFILEGRQDWVNPPAEARHEGIFDRRRKVCKDWAATQTAPILNDVEHAMLLCMKDAVYEHDNAADILNGAQFEKVIRSEGDVCIQSRLDIINPRLNCVADLKTCESLDNFERDALRFDYIEQLAFYRRIANYLRPLEPFTHADLIAVEKQAPFRVGHWQIDSFSLRTAEERIEDLLEAFHKAVKLDSWPTNFELTRTLCYTQGL